MTARGQRSLVGCAGFAAVVIVLAVEIALVSAHVFGPMVRTADSLLAEDPTTVLEAPTPTTAPGPSPWRWLGLVCAGAGVALTVTIAVLTRAGGALSPGMGYRRLLRMAAGAAAGGVLVFIVLSRPLSVLGGPMP